MEFKYILDPNVEEPIMLVDKHIGYDTEDGEGIMGNIFTRELMFLDTLNKKSIQVWVCSGGGVVIDAEQIVGAILSCKTPVDTTNMGTAASCAGPIVLAGRNRYMMDYAKFMMHPVSGGDEKSSKAYEQSIRTMLSSRSFLNDEQVKKLMDRTTWIFHDECEQLGLCTSVIYADMVNKNSINTETATYKDYKTVLNKIIETKKPIQMSKVTNKLGLNESANEDAILNAIESMEAKFKAEALENKSKFDKYVDEMANAKKLKDEADCKYNELKASYDAMQEKEATNKAEALKVEATNFIAENVKLGKIENKAEVIEKMTASFIASPDTIKEVLNAIPAKVTGIKFDIDNKDKGVKSYTAMDINNANLEKYNNKNK